MYSFSRHFGQLIVGILFGAYWMLTLYSAQEISKEVIAAVILAPLLYLQSVAEFLYFYRKRGVPRLQDWLRISLFIMVVLNFMTIVNTTEHTDRIWFIVGYISLNHAFEALAVMVAAYGALDISYLLFKLFYRHRYKAYKKIEIKHKRTVFALLGLTVAANFYLLITGMSGYGSALVYTTGIASLVKMLVHILSPFALVLSAYILFIENRTKHYKILFYLSILALFFVGLLSGMKENAFVPLLYVGIVYLVSGRKIPSILFYTILTFFVLLYPLNTAYRHIINDPYSNTGSHLGNIEKAFNDVLKKPISETLAMGIESYQKRGAMYPFYQYSIEHEPDWHYYKHMNRYLYLPIVWIVPRAVWPDKPRADVGGIFYDTIVGEKSRTAVTPTCVGWAYLEGGMIFVIIIFFLLGTILEYIDHTDRQHPLGLLFFSIILHKSLKPEWDPYFLFTSLLEMLFIYWIALKVIGIRYIKEGK